MTDKFSNRTLQDNDENHSPGQDLVGSYNSNSFFELYNNQHCIKSDLTRKPQQQRTSFNRSEEDEESSNLNEEDDLNFDDLDDFGNEPRNLNNNVISSEEESDPDEEELDKFDEDNQENLTEDALNSLPINQRFRKQRSNSRTINEDELSTSLKQYAKSLPVSIPNWKPFSTNNRRKSRIDDDENLDWVRFIY